MTTLHITILFSFQADNHYVFPSQLVVVKLGDAALVSAWKKLILDLMQSQTPKPQVVLRMSFLSQKILDGAMCIRE